MSVPPHLPLPPATYPHSVTHTTSPGSFPNFNPSKLATAAKSLGRNLRRAHTFMGNTNIHKLVHKTISDCYREEHHPHRQVISASGAGPKVSADQAVAIYSINSSIFNAELSESYRPQNTTPMLISEFSKLHWKCQDLETVTDTKAKKQTFAATRTPLQTPLLNKHKSLFPCKQTKHLTLSAGYISADQPLHCRAYCRDLYCN